MKVIAHRGDCITHPENTLPAFQAAFEANAYGIEFDVRLTADLVTVVFHYFSLINTTGTGFLCDHTYDEIKHFRVLGRENKIENGKEYHIPCFCQAKRGSPSLFVNPSH